MTDASARPLVPVRVALDGRDLLLCAVVVGFFNAEYIRLWRQVAREGLFEPIFATFGISIIVWLALYAVLRLLRESEPVRLTWLDSVILGGSCLLFFVPVTAFSSVGLTIIGVYFSVYGSTDKVRSAMRILTALTVALMWGRFSFSFLLPYILQADASLVSIVTGLERQGNLILAADHKTILQVGAGCSSFLNLTNGALGWAASLVYYAVTVTLRRIAYLLALIASILAINTVRIGLIGWYPDYYDLLHGSIGANTANLITSAVVLFFCYATVKK
jgi:hypothetical protein